MRRSKSQMFQGVTSLSNKCYSYYLWLLLIAKSRKKKRKKVISLTEEIEVFLLKNISPPPPSPVQYSIQYSNTVQYISLVYSSIVYSVVYKSPQSIKFVLCPYIWPEHINRILWFDYLELWVDNVHKNYAGWMSSYSKICSRQNSQLFKVHS